MSDSDQSTHGQQPTPPEPVQPRYGEYAPQPYQMPQQYGQYQAPQQYQQYGQPYAYPVQQYAPVAYAPYAAPQPRGFSITAMILGLAGILFWFTFLVPVGAIVFGIVGLKKEPTGRGMAIAGIVLGGLCFVATLLVIVFWVVATVAAAGTAATIGSYSSVNP